MIVMHSLFDLEENCSVADYQAAIKNLSDHLIQQDLLVSSRFMQREPHDGYNADAPNAPYYLAMEFSNMTRAENCWAYVGSDIEQVKKLHDKIKSNIKDSSFFLCRDVL